MDAKRYLLNGAPHGPRRGEGASAIGGAIQPGLVENQLRQDLTNAKKGQNAINEPQKRSPGAQETVVENTALRSLYMRQITTIELEKMRQQFAELFLRERETILKAARRWCFNHQQNAEYCVDEAFTRLWEQMASDGQVPPSPLRWLYKTARRVEIDRARSSFARHGTVEAMDEITSHESGPDAELIEELLQAMEQLPARPRRALTLHYLEQYSYAEIAEEMSCTVEAVKQILQRARNNLHRRLAHRFVAVCRPKKVRRPHAH